MTEPEWLSCTDVIKMLSFLRGKASNRKLRLFAVACCRRVLSSLTKSSRQAVEVAERYADKNADRKELMGARRAINKEFETADSWNRSLACGYHAAAWSSWVAAECTSRSSRMMIHPAAYRRLLKARRRTARMVEASKKACRDVRETDAAVQAAILRDQFTPFRKVILRPSLRSTTVVAMAKQMYDARDFSTMPILADALQDAGCDDDRILEHCRESGQHVRGCWLLDLVLGMK